MMVNQDTYRQPIPRGWRERWMQRLGMNTMAAPLRHGELTVPNWLTGKSIIFFFVTMFACWGVFGYVPDLELWMVAALSTVLFFYGGQSMSKSWERKKDRTFVRNVFIVGFVIRLIWVLYCYFFFNPDHFGNSFGDESDTAWYIDVGQDFAKWLSGDLKLSFSEITKKDCAVIDDVGYPMWLGIVYMVVGVDNNVFIPLVLKCLIGAYCAICAYRIAKRHFGEGVARIAAIFVCVNPNMIYWCASMMKEAEMVFLTCLAVDNLDKALSSGSRLTLKSLWPGLLAGVSLFFFRTALGLALFLAVLAHIVMASNRVIDIGKKIIVGILVVAATIFSVGDRLVEQSRSMYEDVQSGGQQKNMEWRSNREGGNAFAKYAGAAVFAPLIFTIPFPTFNVANESQIVQVQLSGGSYIKNILSFFVLIVMFMMLISGEWRRHVFILAYTVGYLSILVMSAYAQSGRFHMPVIPMLMLFAAYGVQIAKVNIRMRKWFSIALMVEFVACIAWNWFKLKGRGMI